MNNESRKENDREGIGIARLLSPADVAGIMGISVKTVHKLVRDQKLACVQVTAKERRFTEEQVRAYIESRTKIIRVDRERGRSVSSSPKKGGERGCKAKSFEAQVKGSLVEELEALCR
jgi:excisionase family DNA binding protein